MFKKISIVLLVCCWGCTSDTISPIDSYGTEYFPLETGNYIIYTVDQTTFELGNASNHSFQLKETVVDSFLNQAGTYTYSLHREIWDDINQAWNLSAVWSTRLTDTEAIVAEGNKNFLKLKFPLISEKEWDGNLYNTNDMELYKADSIGFNHVLNPDLNIEQTITIVQNDNLDKIVETDYRIEKYAPGIGLIFKEITNLEYCTSSDACLGQQIVESGFIYKQAMIAFGNE
jgi:hypothetical protein